MVTGGITMKLAILKNNVLMALAEQAYNNIQGINPYERRNVFKYGNSWINHLVFIREDYIINKYKIEFEDMPQTVYHPTLNIKKLAGRSLYSITFRYGSKETNELMVGNPTQESLYSTIKKAYNQIPLTEYEIITYKQIFNKVS